VIRYEHPLNERIRTLMRLEDLFSRARFFAARAEPQEHHAALTTLFEIGDVAARADLKSDLLQELERQRQVLQPLRENPTVDARALDSLMKEVEQVAGAIYALPGKAGMHLRGDDWLGALRQRAGIPGGMSEFDLPSYHYWLHQDSASRQKDLRQWLEPMLPIHAGLSIVLRLLRDSGKSSRHVAYRGTFQLMLTSAKVAQLLRLAIPKDRPCIPEISANRYALNIRLLSASGPERGRVFTDDVEFELNFCNL
jgi:cell division protein ZapD